MIVKKLRIMRKLNGQHFYRIKLGTIIEIFGAATGLALVINENFNSNMSNSGKTLPFSGHFRQVKSAVLAATSSLVCSDGSMFRQQPRNAEEIIRITAISLIFNRSSNKLSWLLLPIYSGAPSTRRRPENGASNVLARPHRDSVIYR